MLILKVHIMGMFVLVSLFLYFTATLGKRITMKRKLGQSETSAIWLHVIAAGITFALTLFAIGLTEELVRKNGGIQNPIFFSIHIPFASVFLLMLLFLVLRPLVTLFRKYHLLIAKTCMSSYVATVITGAYLLLHG